MKNIFILFIIVASLGCTQGGGSGNQPTWEYMPDMADSPAIKAQEEPMRMPVAGSLPRGFHPYPFKADEGEKAGNLLSNPHPLNRVVLQKGQKTYDTYCIVCHGPSGKGNGFIVPKFPMPPSLHSDKVRQWPEGRIFHVMTTGQNLMPSYASQMTEEERWTVVHYVRALQRAVAPTAEDVEVFQKALMEKGNP